MMMFFKCINGLKVIKYNSKSISVPWVRLINKINKSKYLHDSTLYIFISDKTILAKISCERKNEIFNCNAANWDSNVDWIGP